MAEINVKSGLLGLLAVTLGLSSGTGASAGVMSQQMLETRSMEAVEALAKAGGFSGCQMRESSLVPGLYFMECASSRNTAVWAGWTMDGETTSIAALNEAAQAITPPTGTRILPEYDPKFLKVDTLPAKMQAAAKLMK